MVVIALVVAWWRASTPAVYANGSYGAPSGVEALSDPIEQTKWLQTGDVALLAYTVSNPGPLPVVLSVPPIDEAETLFPRQRVGFSKQRSPAEYAPETTEWTELETSTTVAPGEEVWVVARILYPEVCRAEEYRGGLIISTVRFDARVLMRTTTLELPLAYPLYIPTRMDGLCQPSDFADLEAAFPVR